MRLVDAACVVGFACLLCTLLLYSASAMPFQRFASLPDFVTVLGHALRLEVPAAALAGAVALTGLRRWLRIVPVRLAFALALVAGNGSFCAMALGGAWPSWTFWPVGACIAAGCLGGLLAWGRVLARYNLRRATCVVAASSALAALLGWLQLVLGEVGAVVVFMACSLAACAVPLLLERAAGAGCDGTCPAAGPGGGANGAKRPGPGVEGAAAEGWTRGASREGLRAADGAGNAQAEPFLPHGDARGASAPLAGAALSFSWGKVRAFLEMTFVPGVGLALFAMLMAVRGEFFFEDYGRYVEIQLVVCALLFVCTVRPASVPLLRAVYQGLIPVLSVAMLTLNYLSEVLVGGTTLEVALVMVLYSVAALLTVSTLVGMAHAGEFSSDLVVCVGVALFCLVTVGTQVTCAGLAVDPSQVRKLIALTSGLYAAGMVAHALWRALRAGGDSQPDLAALLRGTGHDDAARPVPEAAAPPRDVAGVVLREEGIDDRCDALAREFSLTAREREVLGLLARGHNGVYISEELLISPNTARTHIHNIYGKLGVATREEVLRLVHG